MLASLKATPFLTLLATASARAIPQAAAIGPFFDPSFDPGSVNATQFQQLSSWACVYIATGPDWTGDKAWGCTPPSACSNVAPQYLDQIRSFGPDKGAGDCVLHDGDQCSGAASKGIRYPGNGDLSTTGWGDRARSLVCYG